MSTSKTSYLKLHSWAANDQVLRTEFNANFTNIDSKLKEFSIKHGGGEVYTGSYVGTGAQVHSLTFPKAPIFLIVQREEVTSYYSGFIRDSIRFMGQSNYATLSLSGGTLTLTAKNADDLVINRAGINYHYIAFAIAG